jgi:hypothetical protein
VSVRVPTELEQSIAAEIEQIAGSVLAKTQQGEVSMKFLRLAGSLASEGKAELAERKRKAARTVLTGVYEDD